MNFLIMEKFRKRYPELSKLWGTNETIELTPFFKVYKNGFQDLWNLTEDPK